MPERLQEIGTWLAGISAAIALGIRGIRAVWKIGANTKRILELAEVNDQRTDRLENELTALMHRVRNLDAGPGEMRPIIWDKQERRET